MQAGKIKSHLKKRGGDLHIMLINVGLALGFVGAVALGAFNFCFRVEDDHLAVHTGCIKLFAKKWFNVLGASLLFISFVLQLVGRLIQS